MDWFYLHLHQCVVKCIQSPAFIFNHTETDRLWFLQGKKSSLVFKGRKAWNVIICDLEFWQSCCLLWIQKEGKKITRLLRLFLIEYWIFCKFWYTFLQQVLLEHSVSATKISKKDSKFFNLWKMNKIIFLPSHFHLFMLWQRAAASPRMRHCVCASPQMESPWPSVLHWEAAELCWCHPPWQADVPCLDHTESLQSAAAQLHGLPEPPLLPGNRKTSLVNWQCDPNTSGEGRGAWGFAALSLWVTYQARRGSLALEALLSPPARAQRIIVFPKHPTAMT